MKHAERCDRREKGDDRQKTLTHLAALAVHLEGVGKSAEAAELQREHGAPLAVNCAGSATSGGRSGSGGPALGHRRGTGLP